MGRYANLALEVLQGVAKRQIEAMAAGVASVPGQLRGLILHLLVEPDDLAALAALRDYADERLAGRPLRVRLDGGFVGMDEPIGWHHRFWDRIHGRYRRALKQAVYSRMTEHYKIDSRGEWVFCDSDPVTTLAAICSFSAADLRQLYGIGPAAVRAIRESLFDMGLSLCGETAFSKSKQEALA
jgi:hypothetical protein